MKKFLAFLLACLTVFPLFVPFPSAATTADTPHSLAFDNPNAIWGHRVTVSPADLLRTLIGAPISETEASYLDAYFGESLVYSDDLPDTLLAVEQTDEGEVTVRATPYEYTATNGRTVTRLPLYALCGNQRKNLSLMPDGSYEAVFEGLEGIVTVTVSYHGGLSLSASTVNRLLNYAYTDALRGEDAEAEVIAYEIAKAEHEAYITALLDYSLQKKKYDAYVTEKNAYDELLAAYEQNGKDWEAYRTKKKAYDTYLSEREQYYRDLDTYRTEYAAYEKNVAAHTAYLNNLTAIRSSIATMESLYIKPEGYNSLYKALQNAELVSMFEKYQSILTANFGVPASEIKALRQSSDRLNELLKQYAEKRDCSEKDAFLFYKQHYGEIRDRFNHLYEKLTQIMTPPLYLLMCGKLELEYGKEMGAYKKNRIKIVLSHIYRICLCLDDTETVADTWQFFNDEGDPHSYYFANLLDKRVIIADTNQSDPSSLNWIDEVPLATPPKLPTEPTPVDKPVAPPTLTEPTPPTVVDEPTKPTVVEEPKAPSAQTYAWIEQTKEIRKAKDEGLLSERREKTEETVFSLPSASLSKSVSLIEATPVGTAYFPSADGSESLSEPFLSLDALPTPPNEYSDPQTVYTFRGWSLSPEEYQAPTEMKDGLSLYAFYDRSLREYRVTFLVDGQESITQSYHYGEQPVYPGGTPTKEQSNTHRYTFSTWSPPLRSVTEDMTYEARFSEEERRYSVTFRVNGQESYTLTYRYGETPSSPVTPISFVDGVIYYSFGGWSPPITAVTQSTVYEATYRQTLLASLPNQTEGELNLTASADGYTLTVSGETVSFGSLTGLAAVESRRLTLDFADHGLTFLLDQAATSSLWKMGAMSAALLLEDGENGRGVGICFFDSLGNKLRPNGEMRLRINHGFSAATTLSVRAFYENGFYTNDLPFSNSQGVTEVIASSGVYYRLVPKYTLTVLPSENGTVLSAQPQYAAGESISLTVFPNGEYRLESLCLKNRTTGETHFFSSAEGLTMPASDAELTAVFVPVTYTVTFVYHGGSTVATYRLGEEVEIPAIPTSFEEDGFFYTFLGWSTPVTMVTGDATYTAKYYSVRAEEVSDDGNTGNTWWAIFRRIVLPIGGIALGIAAAITVPTVLLVRKKKKKRRI